MAGPLDDADQARARALHLHLEPLTLQQVVVHAPPAAADADEKGRAHEHLVKVARYHLVDRFSYMALPWVVLAFNFLVNLVIAGGSLPGPQGRLHRRAGDASTSSCSSAAC